MTETGPKNDNRLARIGSWIRKRVRQRVGQIWHRGAVFLDRASKWAILVAVTAWGYDYVFVRPVRDRIAKDQSIYQAWQVINTASGKSGEGGRLRALKQLKEAGQSLHGTNLDGLTVTSDDGIKLFERLSHFQSGPLRLDNISLKGALFYTRDGRGVNLHSVRLRDLSGANLPRANLSRAWLAEADLSNAILREANLSNAILSGANLSNAYLWWANLSNADLRRADLSDANLWRANLSNAYLWQADLTDANLKGAKLNHADLREAKGLTARQIAEAYWTKSTKWPDGFREDMISADLPEERIPPPFVEP